MKNYADFAAEDFAADDDFIKWVRHPQPGSSCDQFWKRWIQSNPGKAEEIEEARMLILAVAGEPQHIAEEALQREVWQRINTTLGVVDVQPIRKRSPLRMYYSIAAMLVLLLGGLWVLWRIPFSPGVRSQLTVIPEGLEEQTNNTSESKTIVLEDGTSVVLQPRSTLQYPRHFAQQGRYVYLTGQAFFEVKRDVHRPFLVHTQELITRVLGTSFHVRNVAGEAAMSVQVKSGKVSVYKAAGETPEADAVVLMPNQQVTYARAERKLTKSLVPQPEVLKPFADYSFEFNDVPVSKVFETIEKAYGVKIVYDPETLAQCSIHATLTDVPLYDKLRLVCKGIGGTYEIIDSHIIITAGGCKQ